MDGLTPPDAVALAEALQRKFVTRRKRWARSVGLPYTHDLESPEPAVIDDRDDQEG